MNGRRSKAIRKAVIYAISKARIDINKFKYLYRKAKKAYTIGTLRVS